ncbi:MAG: peptidoglycan-binding domain-containing protein [bacterium]|nr:peptidoglycan-binding domain-containing protein [bacterium]
MLKRILFSGVGLVILATPLLASAQSVNEQITSLLALIKSLQAQIVALQAQSGGQSFCHNFNNDLTVGSSGDEVSALNQALSSSGINTTGNTSVFDENNAGDVVSFQAKYGIRQTGYVGPLTRGKLNALYGCRNNQQQTQTTAQTTTPATTQTVIPTVIQSATPVTQPIVTTQQMSTVAPMLSYINPTSAKVGGTVWVYGANFNQNTYVAFDGDFGQVIYPDNAPASGTGVFSFTIPSNASVGHHTVQVNEKGATFSSSNSVTLNVVAPQPVSVLPIISSLSLPTAKAGDLMYVYGSGLYGNPFSIDGNYVTSLNSQATDGTSVSFWLPSNLTPGRHVIKVEQKATGIAGTSILFNVVAPQSTNLPNISSITSEFNGPIHAGDMVIVNGTNLYGAPFTIDGNYGTPVSQQNPSGTSFSFVVPWSTSADTHTLQVMQIGSGTLGNSVTFTVVASQAPTISYINPTSAKVGGTVWVYGANFNQNTYVAFDGDFGQVIYPDNAPASGTGVFSFTVPSNASTGSHTIQVNEKGATFPSSGSVTLNIVP